MNQAQREQSSQPVTVRAEELLDRMGQRLGHFTALAGQRIQRTAASVGEEVERLDQPGTDAEQSSVPAIAGAEEAGRRAVEKALENAEELVDRMGQRLSHSTSLVGLQIQRATARVREEAEDFWAEVQNIRSESGSQRRAHS